MMFNASNDQLRDECKSYTSSSNAENCFLSLLRYPLLCLDEPSVSSSPHYSIYHPILSFENPFDDPKMEPFHLRICESAIHHARVSSESIFTGDDSLASAFFREQPGDEPTKEEANHHHNTIEIPNPAMDLAESKRNFNDAFAKRDPFDNPDLEPLPFRMCATDHIQISPESIFTRDDSLPSPFFMEPMKEETNHRQNTIHISNPVINPVDGSNKRKSDMLEAFVDHDDKNGEVNIKRQRTTANSEEYIPRFRPTQEKQWRAQFQKLIEFKLKNGHCRVPHDFPEDQVLSRWVKRQRYQYKKFQDNNPTSTMTTSRIKELESIGFVWNSHTTAWQDKFDELTVFKQRTGHCRVPSNFPENEALSTWVKCQRRQGKRYRSPGKSSSLTKERFEALEALGFVFDPISRVN